MQISDAWLANGSFGFSGTENTGRKLISCLGAYKYVSKRYSESYVNKADLLETVPVRQKKKDVQLPQKCLNLSGNSTTLSADVAFPSSLPTFFNHLQN